uniref:PHD-type domain-containing protein n=1 Tax=Ditylenchus dipsaci TaxID=166011 RepID=A0A915EI48_9BILA
MMRKIYLKSARADKWENSLVKFCSVCPALESELLQLQRYSYNDLPLSLKLTMLKALCESQFDCNVKFKENLFNTFQTNEIRISPIGVDLNGLSYYYQQDCELNIRVYTVEPDDQSGGTWTLKAKSKAELAFLIDLLKSPDFGKRGDDAKEDEEIDEDQLVNKNPTQNGEEAKSSNAEQKPLPADIEMTVEERQGIQMFNKRYSFWDCYQDGSNLNKKKTAKELRKKEKESSVQPPTNVKFEEKPEPREIAKDKRGEVEEDAFKSSGDECKKKEEEPVHPELEESLIALASEERRIMPRRSARSNAINNMKAYTAPPKKGILALTNTPSTPKAKKEPFKSEYIDTEPIPNTSDEDELFDEEDQEDEESHSSDDEFHLDGSRRINSAKPNTSRSSKKKVPKRERRNGSQRQTGKPPSSSKSAKNRPQKKGAAPAPVKVNHHKAPVMNFVDSSDEEEEAEALKERKKATEKTLCMQCSSSKRPDVLLLCDMCDDAWHTYCLKPNLWFVPDGDWFCPKCQHSMLVQKLSLALVKLTEALKPMTTKNFRKQTVADRLKREMDFIGVSLNNIIPSNSSRTKNGYLSTSQSDDEDEEEEEDDGQRKSKKKALRKVLGKTGRQERHREMQNKYYGPIMTIAEGRSRRTLTKVDYNFHAYDEQLQEAMETIDSSAKIKDEPMSGLGRGKDMANIIEEDRKRKASVDANSENNAPATPVSALEQDNNATESDDTDEYKATSESEKSDEPEPSEDEYLPREFRRSGRRTRSGKTRSDEEFIDDNASSSSEYGKTSKRNKSSRHNNKRGSSGRHGKAKRGSRRGGKKGKSKPWESDEETSEAEQASDYRSDQGSSGSDDKKKKKKGGRPPTSARPPVSKWAPKASSSSEEDEEELEMPSGSSSGTRRQKRAQKVVLSEDEAEFEPDEEEEDEEASSEGEKDEEIEQQEEDEPPTLVKSNNLLDREPANKETPTLEKDEKSATAVKEGDREAAVTEDKPEVIVAEKKPTGAKQAVQHKDDQNKKEVPAVEPPKELEPLPKDDTASVAVDKDPAGATSDENPRESDPKAQKPAVAKVVQRVQKKPTGRMYKQSSQEESNCSSPSSSQPPKLNSPAAMLNKAVNSPAIQGPSTPSTPSVGSPKPHQLGGRKASNPSLLTHAPSTSSPLMQSPPPSQPYHSMQSSHPSMGHPAMPVYSNFFNMPGVNKPMMTGAPPMHPYAMNPSTLIITRLKPSLDRHFPTHHLPTTTTLWWNDASSSADGRRPKNWCNYGPRQFGRVQSVIKEQLSHLPQRFSITCDVWTDSGLKNAYLGVTLHFVDADTVLQQIFLGLRQLEGSHTSHLIKRETEKLLQVYGISLSNAFKCQRTSLFQPNGWTICLVDLGLLSLVAAIALWAFLPSLYIKLLYSQLVLSGPDETGQLPKRTTCGLTLQ